MLCQLQTNNFSGDGFLTEYVNVNLFIIRSHDTIARISIENKPDAITKN
jgi:hypothetical protein